MVAISVATEPSDGFNRFKRSLEKYNYTYEVNVFKNLIIIIISCFLNICFIKVFGLGQKWNGGNMKTGTGGGQKVNILAKELEKYKFDDETVLLFTDR